MERCTVDETKLWEKTRERTARESHRLHRVNWGPEVPAEALPYLHGVTTPEELRELGLALRECMPGVAFTQVLRRMRTAYGGQFYRESGLPSIRVAS